jgi:hypothetical protein
MLPAADLPVDPVAVGRPPRRELEGRLAALERRIAALEQLPDMVA